VAARDPGNLSAGRATTQGRPYAAANLFPEICFFSKVLHRPFAPFASSRLIPAQFHRQGAKCAKGIAEGSFVAARLLRALCASVVCRPNLLTYPRLAQGMPILSPLVTDDPLTRENLRGMLILWQFLAIAAEKSYLGADRQRSVGSLEGEYKCAHKTIFVAMVSGCGADWERSSRVGNNRFLRTGGPGGPESARSAVRKAQERSEQEETASSPVEAPALREADAGARGSSFQC